MENVRNAVRVFAIVNNKVVCIKYKNNNKGYLDIPGGKIEDGETEKEACKREFKEETGMDVSKLEYKGQVEIIYPDRKFIMNTYIANEVSGFPHEVEENYSYWMSIDDIVKNNKRFAITHLLDDKLIENFKSGNMNITFICDDNHNVLKMDLK